MSQHLPYPGQELELFAEAHQWKAYIHKLIQPFLGEKVLEVGAGIGGMTKFVNHGIADDWLCLEPDEGLLAQLHFALEQNQLPGNVRTVHGTLASLGDENDFSSLLYMDVLEHIEADQEEVSRAHTHLRPGGHLVVLSPAHQFLYTPFDKSIGHFRRYSKSMIRALQPENMELIQLRYLDSVGLLASLANRLLLRQEMPSQRQIRFWDRYLVTQSKYLDRIAGYSIGKSVLAIWKKV